MISDKDIFMACTGAVHHWGKGNQVRKCLEEMAELQIELCREPLHRSSKDRIAEELADVMIMLVQMTIVFDCKDEIDAHTERKIARLLQRIREEDGLNGEV